MARERYLLNADEESLSKEEQQPLTKKQKRSNFWYYNKWKFAATAFFVLVAAAFVYSVVTKVEPDYQVALITKNEYDDAVVSQIGDVISKYGVDRNNDGKVVVQMNSYQLYSEGDTQGANYNTVMAGIAKAVSDCETCQSMLFLTDDSSFSKLLPNIGTGFFVNLSDYTQAADDLESFESLREPYDSLAAFSDFKLEMDYSEYDAEELTQVYMEPLSLSLRTITGTNFEEKEEYVSYYEASKLLVQKITGQK